jgi:beta-lactamase class D
VRFALILLAACTASAAPRSEQWADGCFTYRDADGKLFESDHERCTAPRRPFSTFKIANALIALDAGVLDGPDAQMTWDKTKVPDQKGFRADWRKPHTLRTGIAVSAVPYFRTLALQVGEDRMRAGLEKLQYGNRDISGGLDKFWLGGGLRISAAEQLVFVDALANQKLAVSKKAQQTLAEVTILDTKGGAVLHGKTGTGPLEHGKGGWLAWQVGWIAKDGKRLPYAAWIESKAKSVDDARAAREKRLRGTLDALGVFPRADRS